MYVNLDLLWDNAELGTSKQQKKTCNLKSSMMKKYTPLSFNTHKNVKISKNYIGSHVFNESTFPILFNEFEQVQREYPIVIFKSFNDGALSVHALTAFDEGNNEFIVENCWNAQYVPLFVKCHPFSIDIDESKRIRLLIDEQHTAFEGGSEPLFTIDGLLSPFTSALKTSMEQMISQQHYTEGFLHFVRENNLLKPVTLNFTDHQGISHRKNNMLTVIPTDFLSLSPELQQVALHKGYYQAAIYIQASLHSLKALFETFSRRNSPQQNRFNG